MRVPVKVEWCRFSSMTSLSRMGTCLDGWWMEDGVTGDLGPIRESGRDHCCSMPASDGVGETTDSTWNL